MTTTREVHADGWCVRLDLGCQVLRLEVPEAVGDRRRGGGRHGGPPLAPVLPVAAGSAVSAATLLLKAKQFDDGLYAAVELAAQQGAGRFPGKATLLRSLAATLAAGLPHGAVAAATIHAACELGGVAVACPDDLTQPVCQLVQDFLADGNLSRPLGFYTWTDELRAVFHQDRFLQQPLNPDVADDLTQAVDQTPGAADAHAACLRLAARLTNPAKPLGLWDAGKCPPFLPPSRSHEVALFERLYEDRPIPEGFDLMGELIRRVRSGEIDLTPTEGAGWYDRQAWSLEPLVLPDRMPERSRLELGKRYRKHLEDLFRGALALARETHAKQVGGGYGGARCVQQPIRIHPGLTVEPLPTLYARRAACYRFVRSVLEEAFGADALDRMHRLAPEGAATTPLAGELASMETLFAGAAATAGRELGMPPAGAGETAARSFATWREALGADRDVARDARMMVPVFYDVLRRKTKVWAVLGWRATTMDATYRVPPAVVAVESQGASGEPPQMLFGGECHEFAIPVMAEVYVSRVLDRDEFRRHCDRFRSKEAILANLR
jgi:hypothetical protein